MTKLIKKFKFGGPTNHIYKLQEFLNKRGYDLGEYGVDGKWGKNTETAVKQAISDGLLSPESLTDKAITSPTAAQSIKAQQDMYTTGFYRGESDPLYKNMKKVNGLVGKAVAEGKAKIEAENQERAKLHKKKGVVRAEMDERMQREAKAKQEALLARGYNLGKWGADGVWGNASQAAYDKALADGWVYENGELVKPVSRLSSASYQSSAHPMFGTPLNVVSPKSQSTESAPPSNPRGGKAIYLHYPNFKGQAANALKIGNTDVGKEIFGTGNVLPVGHGETLLVDENGKVKYVRYGRYTTGTGHVRGSVKGGNWGIYDYPDMKPDESTEQYINRLLDLRKKGAGHLLEDAKYGAFEAIEVPDVDFQKALDYATTQSNDRNRDEYSITNTCATGACNTIKAGLSTLDGLKTYIPNISLSDADADVGTSAWGLIPGSTNYHAATMRNLGKSYIFNK